MTREVPTYEVGEQIIVRVTANNPVSRYQTPPTDLVGTAEIFAPTKDPQLSLTDRGSPDAVGNFEYTPGIGYVALVDTTGQTTPGTWTLRVELQNAEYTNVSYALFEMYR